MMTMKELLETAMRMQPLILAEDKRDGASLRYVDEDGRFVVEHPDGAVEKFDHVVVPEAEAPCRR
ncbi:MAG: hypothetical protein IKS68_08450 [Mailhella sp.]|nr:hypothetical protein [Mailhella sp.]